MVNLEKEKLSLIGTILTFTFFLFLLPSWVKLRWGFHSAFEALGLSPLDNRNFWLPLLKGFFLSLVFIIFVFTFLSLGSWCFWSIQFSFGNLLNAIALGFGVGLAEELLFRGWLWYELNDLVGLRWGLLIQAVIFSLAHVRFSLFDQALPSLLLGLFLFGILLALRRKFDKGSLWGCVGLHGGMVGLWFFVNSSLITFSPDAPKWLIGPGVPEPNPIGGYFAILAFIVLIFFQLIALAKARLPVSGARKDSSRVDIP